MNCLLTCDEHIHRACTSVSDCCCVIGWVSIHIATRQSPVVRAAHSETWLAPQHFVLPLFIHDKDVDEPISSLPGCCRLSKAGLLKEVEGAIADGIGMVEVFPAVPDALKTEDCKEAFNADGIVPRTVRLLKETYPSLVVVTDVALDPYNSLGHDGIVAHGAIDNDATLTVLQQQAVCHAKAGADIIAPSDMMDGRVHAIRTALDQAGYSNVSILSYTAKYASAFYGPFREALDSAPKVHADVDVPAHKKSYQMDPGNRREALREAALDEAEGADMMMVKPAGPYLDVIAALRAASTLPIAAYHVSGEYAMLKAACLNGWLDERKVVMETLTGIRRAGADIIFTYYARQASRWLVEDRARMLGGHQFDDQ
eukprot:m.160340 g.160340  ORF g.160340 m.160340 type:complete len:370 (+) comp11932_c0_seq1:780-1889(+)